MTKHLHRSTWAASFTGLMLAAALLAAPRSAGAAVDAELRAGVSPDQDAVSVGGGVLTDVGQHSGWFFNPNVELAFGDRRDQVAMSGDFHYDLRQDRATSLWVGAGPALLFTSRETRGTDTDLGVNVLTGIGARKGEVRPFAQLRGTMSDESSISIAGGVRF